MAAPMKTAFLKTALEATTNTGPSIVPAVYKDFVPRSVFEVSANIKRAYYPGHQSSALTLIRQTLHNFGLVIECRDSRIPLTAVNPNLEQVIAGRDRLVVYTKSDLSAAEYEKDKMHMQQKKFLSNVLSSAPARIGLGFGGRLGEAGQLPIGHSLALRREAKQEEDGWGEESQSGFSQMPSEAERTNAVYVDVQDRHSIKRLIQIIKARAAEVEGVMGLRALVVGMPNSGKSSVVNALRRIGMPNHVARVSRVGPHPGVTRRMCMPVSVIRINKAARVYEPIQVVDTPGVFIPFVSDPESMLKFCLVGAVKDHIVPSEIIADYLLFRINQSDPSAYGRYSPPTNDVNEWLDSIARRTGKLKEGGEPCHQKAADWIIQKFRRGKLHRFCLDSFSPEDLRAWAVAQQRTKELNHAQLSLSQARRLEKATRLEKNKNKRKRIAGPE
ncbi:P-loop containing nucleoside triphosphate hydrolase protein [Hypoxylon sp. NC1633]|nr:P-loop containing nucleoside triphosphate hydrolase protein [Hypoxylon sp. NC1633]